MMALSMALDCFVSTDSDLVHDAAAMARHSVRHASDEMMSDVIVEKGPTHQAGWRVSESPNTS